MNENQNILERIRLSNGNEECKKQFSEILKRNKGEAIKLINDSNLSFLSFFAILSEIERFNIYRFLNQRNITALKIIDHIEHPEKGRNYINLTVKNQDIYNTLKWFYDCERHEKVENSAILKCIDIAVAVLLDTYSDKSIINDVVETIFKRNTIGLFFDDLIWAMYRMNEPYAIELIAEKLNSHNDVDIKLAKEILHINADNQDNVNVYQSYKKWLKENDPFLYFTGEFFQFKSNPALYSLDYERKYLNKSSNSYVFKPLEPLNEEENRCLEAFRALNNEEKELLSDYSYKLYNKSSEEWKNWIDHPILFQIKAAKNNSGGV